VNQKHTVQAETSKQLILYNESKQKTKVTEQLSTFDAQKTAQKNQST